MRSFRVVLILITCAVSLSAASAPAMAEVYFRETQSRYDLATGLRSKRDVWDSVRKRGPSHGGRNAIGTAQGKPRFQYKFKREGGRCTVTDIQMKMDVNLHLPRWPSLYSGKPLLKAYYRCIKKTVLVHEREHSRIWYETARAANRRLKSVLRDLPCDQFKSIARKHFRKEIAKGSKRQAAFDRADYARLRYQRCHGITKANLSESVRHTTLQQPWEPPIGHSAPRWSKPAVERRPEMGSYQAGGRIRTSTSQRSRLKAKQATRSSNVSNTSQAPDPIWLALLVLGLVAGLTWLALGLRRSAADISDVNDSGGSWADKIVLPEPGKASTGGRTQPKPPSPVAPSKPTFGKRGL